MLPHLDAAYGFARYLTRDPVTAEDVVQEAFLRAFRMYHTYHGGSARAWLFAIVRNCWRDRASADEAQRHVLISHGMLSTAQTVRLDTFPDPSEGAEAEMIRIQEAARVRSAIEALPEHLREVLVLRTFEDMDYRSIAAMIAVPMGTVMSRLSRARTLLAARLLPTLEVEVQRTGDHDRV